MTRQDKCSLICDYPRCSEPGCVIKNVAQTEKVVARLIHKPEEKCELDGQEFTCCKCGGKFDHTQGTWLPIGEEDKSNPYPIVAGSTDDPPIVMQIDLRKPEVITSKDFTCYDCTPNETVSESLKEGQTEPDSFIIDFISWRDNHAWEYDYREQHSHTIEEQLEIYRSITRKKPL